MRHRWVHSERGVHCEYCGRANKAGCGHVCPERPATRKVPPRLSPYQHGYDQGRKDERQAIIDRIRANPPELEHGDDLHGLADELERESQQASHTNEGKKP